MKLFNLKALAVIAVTAIKEAINLENVFECWIDSIIEDSPLSIKVAVTPYCDMYRVSIRLFNLDTETVIFSEVIDTDRLSMVKELVAFRVREWNLDNPALEPEAPEVPQGEQIAVHRLLDSVWTCVYKHIDADNVELISYDRTNPKGYELEATAHKVHVNEETATMRNVESIDLYKPETRDFTEYDHEHFVKHLNIVNKGHVFSFPYTEEKPAPEAPALSNLDAEKPVIDVYVTTKHKGEYFCWCAESEEFKVMGDTRADAVSQIKEAMILDGITNPVLNIIDGDYNPDPTPTSCDTMAQTETTGSTNVKLFFSTFASKLSASHINQVVSAGNQYRVTFESLNYTDLECELIITDSQTHSIFDYSITITDNKIGTVYDIVTGGAASIAEIKEMTRTCADAWNAENPAFEAERAEYDAAYAALKNFSDDLVSDNGEKLALETLLAVAVEQGKEKAAAILTDLLTNDFDYENSGYMIRSLEHAYQDRYIWDAVTVYELAEVIEYVNGLNPTDPEPTKKHNQPATEGEATENLDTSSMTISNIFGEHGYSKASCNGFEIIYDDKGVNICAMRGSLRSRLAMKWLIVDALVNGRDEQQNEDDFAALEIGDFFDLTFEDGSTRSAGKVDDLQLVCEVFGRYTTIVFQRRWLVSVNPTHKELFAALPVGTELKCSGDHFIVRSRSIGEEGEPRTGLVNVKGEVMSLSIQSILDEIESGKIKRIEQQCKEAVKIDLQHTIKPGDVLLCGKDESTVKSITEHCCVRTAYDGGPDQVDFNDWISGMLYRETLTIKPNHKDRFLSLPIGQPFACDLENGDHIPEAIKTSSLGFTFKHFGTMKTMIFKPGMVCDPEWPTTPDYKLIQDPHNKQKQYILKRENFQEITVFQMVAGKQEGRAKFTEEELLSTFDFIYQYQLNKLLSGNCNSAYRLYKIKQPFLAGVSKNWRIDAKLGCINPDSLNFLTHVAREQELRPLIIRVAEAMEKTTSYARNSVKCWWLKSSITSILRKGAEAGYISFMSTTQVHWTDDGCDELRAALPSGF